MSKWRGRVEIDLELRLDSSGRAEEQHRPVGEADGLAHVVRDEDDGQSELGVDALDLVVHRVAGHGVEGRERLVHQDDLGLLGEHAGQLGALAHTAGQLVRAACPAARRGARARAAPDPVVAL